MVLASDADVRSADRIIAVATRLFAESGYDGVSTRQIAAESGLNISTVHHHVGSKRDLYLAVIEKLFEAETAMVNEVLDGIDEDVIRDRDRFAAAMARLVERVLRHAVENPTRQRLYVRRWLDAPDDLRQREAALTLKLYSALDGILRRGQELGVVSADLDIGYFLRSFDWLIFSYFTSGAFDWKKLRADPANKRHLKRFKTYLINYTQNMLET